MQFAKDAVSYGPLFLIDCEKINATPDCDSASEITGDHTTAWWVEPDQHDRVHMRFAFFLGCFSVLIPYCDTTLQYNYMYRCPNRWQAQG